MKNSLLLANKYKVFGWAIFLVFVALGIACMQLDFKIAGFALYHHEQDGLLDFIDYNLTNELALSGITIGLLMIVFTKEKVEDEYIAMLRLKSLQWAVLLSYVILFIINFSFYGLTFLILLVYNLWTTLVVFIVIFYWSMFKLKKEGLKDEK